jgi:hypothetical protein
VYPAAKSPRLGFATMSMNESLSVEDDGYSLFLKLMGLAMLGRAASNKQLTNQGGAEYFWSLFIEPLQR